MKIHDSATVWAGRPLADGVPLLIVMHGYGANERDLAPLIPQLPGDFAAACVRAPLPIPQMPGGFAWFPITGDPGMPAREIADGAVGAVITWLEEVTAGIEVSRVVLLGFSQGGAMVTHLLRHFPERFAAGVVLSGFTVPGEVASDAELARRKPPVFFGYDPMDPIVPGAAFARTRKFGEEHFAFTSRTYRIGHGINEEEVRDVHEFLSQVLAGPAD